MEKHFGFTGSREVPPFEQAQVLFNVMNKLFDDGFTTQHNGDCIGADNVAYDIWKNAIGGKVIGHPPDNDSKRVFNVFDGSFEPLPYLVRNKSIVRCSEVLIAAPAGQETLRSGTWSTIRYAAKLNKRRIIIFPDGQILVA